MEVDYWNVFVWLMSIIGGMIVILLGVIAFFIKSDRETVKEQLTKHEEWILDIQQQVHEGQEQTKLAIQAIQMEQKFGSERIEQLADQIASKLRK